MIYFGKTKTNIIAPGENESKENIRWFTREDLNDPVFDIKDRVAYYAKKALGELAD